MTSQQTWLGPMGVVGTPERTPSTARSPRSGSTRATTNTNIISTFTPQRKTIATSASHWWTSAGKMSIASVGKVASSSVSCYIRTKIQSHFNRGLHRERPFTARQVRRIAIRRHIRWSRSSRGTKWRRRRWTRWYWWEYEAQTIFSKVEFNRTIPIMIFASESIQR